MTKLNQVYKCNICGNVVEMVHEGVGGLVCCGQPMELLAENSVDAAKEKHVPVAEKVDGGVKVKVGSEAHPMTEEHFIEWIEVISGGKVQRLFLKPGDSPEGDFVTGDDELIVRAYCNLHGLWKSV